MGVYEIIFYLFAAVTLVSAFFVVTSRNIVHAAFYLLFTFFGVAGIYVLLGADFVAIVQLIVDLGGIRILRIFGVMITNKITEVDIKTGTIQTLPAAIGIGLFTGVLGAVILNTEWRLVDSEFPESTLSTLGSLLITEYVLILKLLGILLLVALIGAASMARK